MQRQTFFWSLVVPLTLAACGGSGAAGPGSGGLSVTVTTTGSAPDTDGYVVILNDTLEQPVAPGGTATWRDLPSARYAIRLGGMRPNCFPAKYDVHADVGGGQDRAVSFSITCPPAVPGGPLAWDAQLVNRLLPAPVTAVQPISSAGGRVSLSPGGSRLAIRDSRFRISITTLDGTRLADLSALTGYQGYDDVVWSPAGDWIAFEAPGGAESDVVIVRPDGTARKVHQFFERWMPLAFSPDARYLLLWHTGQVNGAFAVLLERVEVRTGARHRLYTGQEAIRAAAYHPDGSVIAFSVSSNTSGRVYEIPADGGTSTPLASGISGQVFHLAWSPGGDSLLVHADSSSIADGVYLVVRATKVRSGVYFSITRAPHGIAWLP